MSDELIRKLIERRYAQLHAYRDGVWQEAGPPKPEPLTFHEYVFQGEPSRQKLPHEGEVICPVCSWSGKELVLDDRVRIYHPGRLFPCRAPEGYEPVLQVHDQLVPA